MHPDQQSIDDAQHAGDRLLAGQPSEDPFAAAFKATRMSMIITDPRQDDNPIIFSNRAFSDLTGYAPDEMVGRNCRILQGPDTDKAAVERIRNAIHASQSLSVNVLNYRKDGSQFWNALYLSPVRDTKGEVIYFFASQLDFTEVKNNELALAAAHAAAEREVEERTHDLRQALVAKTMLVHEVDHRVKNNLLTIASILKLQARASNDQVARGTLRSVLERVEALSTVQRMLFTTHDVTRFDVATFTRELVSDMVNGLRRDDIQLELELSPVLVPALKASPLALIVNELVADPVRRGLRQGGGFIKVTVKHQDSHLLIEVADVVAANVVNPDEEAFARLILDTCARQLGARLARDSDKGRAVATLILPIDPSHEGAHP
ncbi:PAS domain-containing protein [Rhizobium sp. CG5]|uniref:PAS domain-containing protein n=1 Tax=Rhizobium sp. CG5 TaxID=2726076 RepID=UPI002033EE79|nr:PAS domain-containing protein [Rhizobium sp. CG5]MCM2476277.1 PAS domain-containing protein [Rhizobium sp. CG5]